MIEFLFQAVEHWFKMEQHQQKIKLFENIVRAHKKKVDINSQTLRFNRTLAMFENSPKSTSSSSGGNIFAF